MSRSSLTRIALAACLAAGSVTATSPVLAQASAPAAASAGAHAHRLARADVAFLKQAAENGHAEVEGSKLALSKGSSDKVKSFAQQMVDDHTKASAELMALASSKGVEVPNDPSLMQKGKLKLLAQADGASFDRKYASEIGVKAHEDTVKLFQKAANGAKDADVKAWAAKTLPTLKMHLEHARALKAAVGTKS